MKLSEIKIDSAAVEGGAWRKAVGLSGVEFHLRGAGNSAWDALNEKLHRELPAASQHAVRLAREDVRRITVELLVGACLLDWRGIEDDQGKPIAFSPDVAREMLSDPDMARLRNSVAATAAKLSDETLAERDAASGN